MRTTPPMGLPQNKQRIVITGVSRGLGRALADGFIRRGLVVAGCARRVDAVKGLARQYGPPHSFFAVDVAKPREVRRWSERVLAAGPVDMLLNNAALINRCAPLWKISASEFRGVVDVNVRGVFHVVRAFLPDMLRRKKGIVVNFSSGWGRSTSAEVAPYCATKWAIEGLTQALAQELPPGMAAVSLNPGIIDTPMLRSCFGDEAGSYPSPEQWAARAVPWLLSLNSDSNGLALTIPDGD